MSQIMLPVIHGGTVHAHRKHRVLLGITMFVLFILFLTYYTSLRSVAAPAVQQVSTQALSAKPTVAAPTVPEVSIAVQQPVQSAGSLIPACALDASFHAPGALNLTSSNGVVVQVDPVHYYQVYGNSGNQVRQQIIACAPKLSGDDDFTGYTASDISWRYITASSGGQCKLESITIGMHISEVLPAWGSASTASQAFTTAWNRFVTALDTHEQGHIAIDKQYAGKLLSDLSQLPADNCDKLSSEASALIKADSAAMDTANSDYDASTNHGASQGAILP
jgi:predicted secreted Zn-dependent protease